MRQWFVVNCLLPARRCASVVLAVILCQSVCQSVRHKSSSRSSTKRLNLVSRKQRRMIVQGLRFADAEALGEIPTG